MGRALMAVAVAFVVCEGLALALVIVDGFPVGHLPYGIPF